MNLTGTYNWIPKKMYAGKCVCDKNELHLNTEVLLAMNCIQHDYYFTTKYKSTKSCKAYRDLLY